MPFTTLLWDQVANGAINEMVVRKGNEAVLRLIYTPLCYITAEIISQPLRLNYLCWSTVRIKNIVHKDSILNYPLALLKMYTLAEPDMKMRSSFMRWTQVRDFLNSGVSWRAFFSTWVSSIILVRWEIFIAAIICLLFASSLDFWILIQVRTNSFCLYFSAWHSQFEAKSFSCFDITEWP